MSAYYLTYLLADGTTAGARFASEDDRDGCQISLDLYRTHLGPVDEGVFARMVERHGGVVLRAGK